MMEEQEEKLKKVFWLRPAFHPHNKQYYFWRLLSSPKHVLIFFFFLLVAVSLLYFATSPIDLGKYSKYYSQACSKNKTEFPLDCFTWNTTTKCPINFPNSPKSCSNPSSKSSSCPEYFRWIHEDLRRWKSAGITKQMVEKARKTAHFRLVILDGKVYVEKFRDSIQTRALFTMWGIVQLVRTYPGKLPDLEMMFDSDDRPVVAKDEYAAEGAEAPPVFRYCSDWRSLDIVFPDWSFWGWAETNIKPWRTVLKDIKEGNKKTKWEDRVPYAYWKGNPAVASWRADLIKCNVTDQNDWNARLYIQDWEAETKEGFKHSNLGDQCTHRYKIYIEGYAWSVSEKYILACDSPTLVMTLQWHDFFVRGMIPQRHYWPVRMDDKCRSLKFAVEWGNNHTAKAKAIGEAGSRYIHEDLKMEYVYDYIFHLLNEYGKLLKYKPTIPQNAVELCAESIACGADGIWRKFMEESMEKYPSDSPPCTMPPPYEPQQVKAFIDEKVKATKEVERWENEYWERKQ